MTLTTSGSTLTAARPRTRPATTSRPARPGESRPAAGGARAPKRSASSPASGSSASRTTCCSASARPPMAPSSAGARMAAGKPPTCTTQLLAAEPHATAERKRELRTEAVRKARQSPLFFDLTLSLSKSISIFHASLGENARLARQAGDQRRRRVLVRPGRRGRRDDLAGRARRVRLLPARGRLHPHRLPRHPGARPGDRPVARSGPGGGALAAAHLPGRRHAAARPLPDRPHRQDQHRREMAGPGLPGLQRAHRRGRRDRLPAPGRSPHRAGSAWSGPPATTATASRSRASAAR